jgi:hypothetical protein
MNEEPVLYGEPLIGWRVWAVNDNDRLVTGMDLHVWQPGEPLKAVHEDRDVFGSNAEKIPPCTDAPCAPHIPLMRPGCGIYAYKQPEELAGDRYIHMVRGVIGTVYLWGRIYEHVYGYRAQYAYPASFIEGCECDIEPLAETYHIPVDKENQLWKSACHNASSSRNRSIYLNPYGAGPLPLPSPNPPWALLPNPYYNPSQPGPRLTYGYSPIPATEEEDDYKPPPMPSWFQRTFYKGGTKP